MTILLFILAILSAPTYSQKCTNTHAQSTLLSISINYASVNKIGVSTYLDVIKQAADEILPAANTGINVGVQSFGGGIQATAGQTNEEFAFAQGDYTSISTTITDLPSTRDFNKHDGNKISAALTAAAAKSWTGQRYNILFTAGNPLSGSGGTTTNPENFDTPCSDAVGAKQNNIQTYVALIGTQGVNYVKQFYSCVVEDVTQDIIEIDPTAPAAGIAALKLRVCKAGGIDVKITEVNPEVNTYRRYIEILNRGAAADIRACFATGYPGSCSNQANVGTGAYFVGYGGSSGNVPAVGTVQNSLGASAGADTWVASAEVNDGSWTSVDTVDTTAPNANFQGQVTGRSFALRAVGFNNNYGANWRMTCAGTANPGFTPGLPPNNKCPGEQNTCMQGIAADDAQCKADGSTAVCDQNNDFCGCTDGWLADADTCISEPTVSTANCEAYVIFSPVKDKDFTYFVWELPYDGVVSYKVTFNKAGAATGSVTIGTNAAPVLDLRPVDIITNGQSTITVETTTVGDVSNVDSVTSTQIICQIGTLEPTVSPTVVPTQSPARSPTVSPTLRPTYDDPGAFIAETGICALPRCECFQDVRTCCTPFGPREDPEALTSGSVPNKGCKNNFKTVEVQTNEQRSGRVEDIYLGKYGDEGDALTVEYTLFALGMVNKTDFRNLSRWTNYYSRRRLTAEIDVLYDENEAHAFGNERSLLQDATPSPTLQYGNKLNIEVSPPGELAVYRGTFTIPAGVASASFPVNISTATLKCDQGQSAECTTYNECQETALAFQLLITNCTSTLSANCEVLYPTTLWISVTRSNELCAIVFGVGSGEDELPDWFWWVLIALIIFLLILAWLVYRFWWKQKKTASELGDAEDELDQQQADNEVGFGKDLDVGDVAFNPMATGVPGMNRPADAFGNELHQRQLEQQNDMVDVQAEIFQVRQDYGQVAPTTHQH